MDQIFDHVKDNADAAKNPEDYFGEDGLLYCGKCHTPKQTRLKGGVFDGRIVPINCKCTQERINQERREQEARERSFRIEKLKQTGFLSKSMRKWTFANDNGRNPQMQHAKDYVSHWEDMQKNNIGLLLWGNVGCGKSYLAGCIANALMEQEVAVRMTNFAAIINDLSGSFEGRNGYIEQLCSFPLLIIDDFGMERGTEYGLEQVYNVIDGRYRSGKPLIVTTNLTLNEIRNPQDTAHARIYDRVLDMCVPILCNGTNFRKESAEQKYNYLRNIKKKGEGC